MQRGIGCVYLDTSLQRRESPYLDGRKINTDDERTSRHAFCGDLAPRTGRSAQIDQDLALLEEVVLLVELDQLEGGTGAVALLLGQLIPLVETAFSMLRIVSASCLTSRSQGEKKKQTFFWMAMAAACSAYEKRGVRWKW